MILLTLLVLLIAGTSARSYNTYSETNNFQIPAEASENRDPEPWSNLYFGIILGWQTQQALPGQWFNNNKAFISSLNDTLYTFFKAYLPAYWVNFLDRIRINIDNLSKVLQSCQIHTILEKLKVMSTWNGAIEALARILTQAGYLTDYFNQFMTHYEAGELTLAGVQVGILTSAIVGVTVN